MACTDCEHALATNGRWVYFNNRVCLYCAARLIQRIQALLIPSAAKNQRSRVILDESVAAGLPEAEIRAMAKDAAMPADASTKKGR